MATTFSSDATGYYNTSLELGNNDIYCGYYLGVIQFTRSWASILGLPSSISWNDIGLNNAILHLNINTTDAWENHFVTVSVCNAAPNSRSDPPDSITADRATLWTPTLSAGAATYHASIDLKDILLNPTRPNIVKPNTAPWYIALKGWTSDTKVSRFWRKNNNGPYFEVNFEHSSNIYIYTNEEWVKHEPYIYTNEGWTKSNVNRFNGDSWENI